MNPCLFFVSPHREEAFTNKRNGGRVWKKRRLCMHVNPSSSWLLPRIGTLAGLTYSVAPAAKQVVGQGVVRLQFNGFIQMILEDRSRAGADGFQKEKISAVDSDSRRYFQWRPIWPDPSCFTNPQVFHKHRLLSLYPTHTRNLAERPHTFGFHTPSPSAPPFLALRFLAPTPLSNLHLPPYYLHLVALYLALFHLLRCFGAADKR